MLDLLISILPRTGQQQQDRVAAQSLFGSSALRQAQCWTFQIPLWPSTADNSKTCCSTVFESSKHPQTGPMLDLLDSTLALSG